MKPPAPPSRRHATRAQRGLSLVELMVALAISLAILLALVTLFANTSRNNAELARTNSQIENGRVAIQLLEGELNLAGFWSNYLPQFDDLTLTSIPSDVPASLPAPCLDYNSANWTNDYKSGLFNIAVQAWDAAPSGCSAVVANQQANTDVLLVRHAEPCVAGSGGNCSADTAGALYFQASQCGAEMVARAQTGSGSTSIKLADSAQAVDDAYVGMRLRIINGTGAGQARDITAYNGAGRLATVNAAWTTTPDATSVYSLDPLLATSGFNLRKRDCSTIADKRKFVSTLYYVRDYAVNPGDGIPTLVQSRFDLSGTTLAHPSTVTPLVEGIEAFRVELGVDNVSDAGTAVNFNQAVAWANASNLTSPTNRGDGSPDTWVHCSSASPCTVAQLSNTVAAKVYVVARARESSPGYSDSKTYTLGSASWSVPSGATAFRRHVFSGSVRLTNVSGRRETP